MNIDQQLSNCGDDYFNHYGFNENSIIIHNHNVQTILGSDSDDIIDGGGGSDIIYGGAGNDTLVIFDIFKNVELEGIGNGYRLSFEETGNEYSNSSIDVIDVERIEFLDHIWERPSGNPLDVTITDTEINEGGSGSVLSIKLNKMPVEAVNVTLIPTSGLLRFSEQELIFDQTNWNQPQTVTLSYPENDTVSDDLGASVDIDLTSQDPSFNLSLNTNDVFGSIKLLDNDTSLSIKGNIWNDFNKNASFEITEHFAENIRVYIDENNNGVFDNNEKNTVTDNLGSYEFST